MPPKKSTRGVTSLPTRQLARARGTPAPTVNVVLPKVSARNKTTKAIAAPVVARPDKEGPPPIIDLDNKDKAPITSDIKSNIDGESPNNGGGKRSLTFKIYPLPTLLSK